MGFKVTYSVLRADLAELHHSFDGALAKVQHTQLEKEHPSWINGQSYFGSNWLEDYNPANIKQFLGKFGVVPVSKLDEVMATAQQKQKIWAQIPLKDRVTLLRRAADLISDRRMEIAALLCLEVGKNRLESLGDVEEAADLLRYYCDQIEEADGYVRPLSRLSPNEHTQSILKPYGVFTVISPFNFPIALSAGMSGAALLGGNSVILKPSAEAPWMAQKLFECFREAGLPDGVFQLVYDSGTALGQALVAHPNCDGVAFTGSYHVGMRIMRSFSSRFPKPCLMEMGGKNPAIICRSADLEKAVIGCVRSAFGLTGQKCSALSRVFVHTSIKDEFLERLIEKTKSLVIGNPTEKNTFLGPLINKAALARHTEAIQIAQRDGQVLWGGENLQNMPELSQGHFVQPAIVEISAKHRLTQDELFTPFLVVDSFDTLESAIHKANDSEYGLTAGIFSEDSDDVEYFMSHIEAGILYSNRETGATTGAWPGVQSFCGWKGSGSSGKGGCGPYYVSQFMREQSQTRMK